MTSNFSAFLAFVWQSQFDSPSQGYHVTPGDAGGATYGGVIETTWQGAVTRGLVTGSLAAASRAQLAVVLRDEFWGPACDGLPAGLDLMLGNGQMMSGRYPRLFQQCLGLTGDDVDGDIGPETQALTKSRAPATFVNALHGVHFAYLQALPSWGEFHAGWTTRLVAARTTALAMLRGANPAV